MEIHLLPLSPRPFMYVYMQVTLLRKDKDWWWGIKYDHTQVITLSHEVYSNHDILTFPLFSFSFCEGWFSPNMMKLPMHPKEKRQRAARKKRLVILACPLLLMMLGQLFAPSSDTPLGLWNCSSSMGHHSHSPHTMFFLSILQNTAFALGPGKDS